jgi:hypothetical protein
MRGNPGSLRADSLFGLCRLMAGAAIAARGERDIPHRTLILPS